MNTAPHESALAPNAKSGVVLKRLLIGEHRKRRVDAQNGAFDP